MRKKNLILIAISSISFTFGQNKIEKDIDFDGKNDTVLLIRSQLQLYVRYPH